MKILGSELNKFLADAWPGEDWYWEHDEFDEFPDPCVQYDTYDLGGLHFQGSLDDDPTNGNGLDLDKLIRKWRKSLTHVDMTFSVRKGKEKEARLAMKEYSK